MTKLNRLTIGLALVAGLAAACGGNGDDTTSGATSAGPTSEAPSASPSETDTPSASPSETATGGAEASLLMLDNVFQPADITVASGSTLVFTNQGAAPHNFSIDGQDIDEDVNAGETEDESIELAPGTYDFFCKFHVADGMTGTLTVE